MLGRIRWRLLLNTHNINLSEYVPPSPGIWGWPIPASHNSSPATNPRNLQFIPSHQSQKPTIHPQPPIPETYNSSPAYQSHYPQIIPNSIPSTNPSFVGRIIPSTNPTFLGRIIPSTNPSFVGRVNPTFVRISPQEP